MSLGIRMTGRVRQKETLIKTAKELAEQKGYGLSVGEEGICFSLCTFGELFLSWKEDNGSWLVEGECMSTPAGAGFHKAAAELVDGLKPVISGLSVDDETGYYQHRDFERMRREHFYPWLCTLINICRERLSAAEDCGNICICWDMRLYQPQIVKNTIVTPLGRFTAEGLAKAAEQGIEKVAERFYIWNNSERDCVFHRNRALYSLWVQCYFRPSERSGEDEKINRFILDNLEEAYRLDRSLPLPVEEYHELCALAGRKPLIPKDAPELSEEFPVGYRRGPVTYTIGNLNLTLPGSYQYEWEDWGDGDGAHQWLDASTDSPLWCVSGYCANGGDAQFCSSDGVSKVHDAEEYDIPGGRARLGFREQEEDGAIVRLAECEVISGELLFIITVTYSKEEQQEEILSLLKKLMVIS